MNNAKDGGPAFPNTIPQGCRDSTSVPYGMSLRQYYAARAPVEVPEWFKHKPKHQKPQTNDGRWSVWIDKDNLDRFFQWRWYYADMMLKYGEFPTHRESV